MPARRCAARRRTRRRTVRAAGPVRRRRRRWSFGSTAFRSARAAPSGDARASGGRNVRLRIHRDPGRAPRSLEALPVLDADLQVSPAADGGERLPDDVDPVHAAPASGRAAPPGRPRSRRARREARTRSAAPARARGRAGRGRRPLRGSAPARSRVAAARRARPARPRSRGSDAASGRSPSRPCYASHAFESRVGSCAFQSRIVSTSSS